MRYFLSFLFIAFGPSLSLASPDSACSGEPYYNALAGLGDQVYSATRANKSAVIKSEYLADEEEKVQIKVNINNVSYVVTGDCFGYHIQLENAVKGN